MDEYQPEQPALQRAWARLSVSCRQERLRRAKARECLLNEVAAKAPQESEQEVLSRVAPDVKYSSFKRWKERYAADGIDGLVDGRIPPNSPLSSRAAAELCTLRRADPQIAVEKRLNGRFCLTGAYTSFNAL